MTTAPPILAPLLAPLRAATPASEAILVAPARPDLAEVMDEAVPFAALGVGLLIAMTAIVSGTIRRAARARQYEQSRREIAAYVAEGSMSPDDARRILESDPSGAPKRT